jgi:hypothetical protein
MKAEDLRKLELQAEFAIANNLEYVAVEPKLLQRLINALTGASEAK